MVFKDLIVSIDPSPAGRQRLKLALGLAQRFKASLIGYYVGPTVGEYVMASASEWKRAPESGPADSPVSIPAEEIADALEQQFEEELKRRGLDGTWFLSGDRIMEDIVDQIRIADLAILGLGDPDASIANVQGFRVEEVVVTCGRPVLGVPIANVPDEIGKKILVAWDGSRGASRAMNDALPFLAEAKSVTVLSVDPGEQVWKSTQSAAAHLRRHGVLANASQIPSAAMGIGDVILAHCEHLDIDLVVAGAFGHSRLRESVVGGVSRTLLHQMMMPVFMSH
jgi:nucleotide-binding universal stress UspA family protein